MAKQNQRDKEQSGGSNESIDSERESNSAGKKTPMSSGKNVDDDKQAGGEDESSGERTKPRS